MILIDKIKQELSNLSNKQVEVKLARAQKDISRLEFLVNDLEAKLSQAKSELDHARQESDLYQKKLEFHVDSEKTTN